MRLLGGAGGEDGHCKSQPYRQRCIQMSIPPSESGISHAPEQADESKVTDTAEEERDCDDPSSDVRKRAKLRRGSKSDQPSTSTLAVVSNAATSRVAIAPGRNMG
jgi:hypothetical protein